jgi:hypothetical protein
MFRIKKRSKPEGAAVRIKKRDNVFANRPKTGSSEVISNPFCVERSLLRTKSRSSAEEKHQIVWSWSGETAEVKDDLILAFFEHGRAKHRSRDLPRGDENRRDSGQCED